MKRLLKVLLRVYPPAWRARYGDELETLLEDTGGAWAPLTDILKEALKMRVTSINWRFAGPFALAGLLLATIFAFRMPDHYESSAALRMDVPANAQPAAVKRETAGIIRNVMSRSSLSWIIQTPGYPLYPQERLRLPLEDIIDDMKKNDMKIAAAPDGSIQVSYKGRSPEEARHTVQLLTTRLMEENQQRQRNFARLAVDHPIDPATSTRLALGTRLEVLRPAALPGTKLNAWRPLIAAGGLLAGLVAAFVCAFIRRNPRTWLYAGLTITFLATVPYQVVVVNNLPLVRYRSQATVVFDSPATRDAVIADPIHLLRPLESPARFNIEFLRQGRGELVIRGTYYDRVQAQRAVQFAITNMVDSVQARNKSIDKRAAMLNGPWVEVSDPPGFPAFPIGDSLFDIAARAGLILTVAAALILLIDRRRSNQPAPASA